MARVRPTSRKLRTVKESARRSTRSARSCSSISPSTFGPATSSTVALSRTESAPDCSMPPNTTVRAPVSRPSACADCASAVRPLQRRTTSVGDTVRSGPAPSRLRDSTSTNPSRHNASSEPPSTSNGATATRFASSNAGVRGRSVTQPAMITMSANDASANTRFRGRRSRWVIAATGDVTACEPLGVAMPSSACSTSFAL